MAITIDQFLQDLTERQLLSVEEAHAVRRRMASPLAECSAPFGGSQRMEPRAMPAEASTTLANGTRLVLCDAVVQGKLCADENGLIFHALRLSDESPVTIHVLVPGQNAESFPARINGTASHLKEGTARPQGIVDVGRHGEMICVCCQSLDGETLEQVVSQNGSLPLELATETLLQTARTLKRLEEGGLSICEVSPELLLLDEEGRIHLMDQHLARLQRSANCHCSGDVSPKTLHQSLGRLYEYLHTARPWFSESSEPAWPADGILSPPLLHRSAKMVFSRLMGNGFSLYQGWDELVRDLEAVLRGQELSMSAASSPLERDRKPSSKTTAPFPQADTVRPKGQQALWWIVGLAVVAAAAITAVSLLGN